MNKVKMILVLLISISLIMTISCGVFAASKGLIIYSVCWTEDPFWVASTDAARAVVEASGFEYKVLNANNDNMTQVNQISDAIALKPAGILLGAVDSRGIVSAVKELQDAGIPIGVIIRNITGAGKIDITVDADMFGIGVKSAINTLSLLLSKHGAYEGTVLEIEGALIDNAAVDFHAGFMSIMEKYPDVTIVSKEATDWSFEKAANIAEDWLSVNPDTDLIWSHSDWLTQALPPVLKRLGYGPAGEDNHIFVVSGGSMPFGLPFIRSGYIDLDTEIPPLKTSKMAAYWLCQIAQGNKIPDEVNLFEPGLSVKMTDAKVKVQEKSWGTYIAVPPGVVTKKTVDDPSLWGNIYD